MADDIFNSAKAAIDGAANSAKASSGSDPDILVGFTAGYAPYTGGTPTNTRRMAQAPQVTKLSKLKEDVLALPSLNPQGYMQVASFLYGKGFLGKSKSTMYNPTRVAGSLDYISDLYLAYQKNTANAKPFWSWLEGYEPPGGGVDALGGGRGGGGGGPRTSRSVSVTDEDTAKSAVNAAAVEQLGRNLTAKEQAKYAKQFNRMEQQNPTVTTTTSSGGSSTSVTQQGMAKEEMLRQLMVKNPDFAKYQIDSSVMDWFAGEIKKGLDIANG